MIKNRQELLFYMMSPMQTQTGILWMKQTRIDEETGINIVTDVRLKEP